MALPMDEQRILEEMERMLAADDPRLAARLAAFGRPGFTEVMRGRRARVTFSLMLLGVVAAAAVVIYILSAFRLASGGPATHLPRATPSARQSVPLRSPAGARAAVPAAPASPLSTTGVVHCLATVAPASCSGGAWQGRR